jgi:choice-of-anchor C domain-containing protein
MKTIITIAIAIALAAATVSAQVVNGDFEDGVDPGETFTRLPAGQTDITGWTILPISVDYVGGYWQASSGTRFVDLDGNFGEPGGIAQTIPTIPGQEYIVRFDMAGLPIPGPSYLKTMQVRAAGRVEDYEFSVVGRWWGGMGWEPRTFIFTATSTVALLEFISTNALPGDGPTVDNVRVELAVAVETSTWGRIKATFYPTPRQPSRSAARRAHFAFDTPGTLPLS